MNDTRWLFELESLQIDEEEKMENMKLVLEYAKKLGITLLGLNMLPVTDEETGLLRMPNDDEVLPLAALTANESVLSQIGKLQEEMSVQDSISQELDMEDDEIPLEILEENEGDIEFLDDPSQLSQFSTLGGLVQPLEEKDKQFESEFKPEVSKPSRRKVIID